MVIFKNHILLIHFIFLDDVVQGPDQTHSIFPADFEWENVRWEDDVIFDPDDMPSIPGKYSILKHIYSC